MPPDETGHLVESGRFRVDRKRALDKLMRFQLKDARMFPLPWIQAAVASGATRIHVSVMPAGFEIAFNGREWDPEELREPYRHLFEGDASGANVRNRELAVGILSALRLRPERVSVTFVSKKKEWSLFVENLEEETLSERPGGLLEDARIRYGAAMTVQIFVARPGPYKETLAYLQTLCRRCPAPITIHKKGRDHTVIGKSEIELVDRKFFTRGGIKGEVGLTSDTLNASQLEFVVRGVTVLSERIQLPGVPLTGFARDDSLRKSMAQIGIVKDDRYEQALTALRGESIALLKECVRKVDASAGVVGKLLKNYDLRRLWMSWEGWSLSDKFSDLIEGGTGTVKEQKTLLETSLRVAALRSACLYHRIAMQRFERGIPELLWDAQILFDEAGRPLTLRALREQARWLATIPYVDRRSAAPFATHRAAWCCNRADRDFLTEFFKEDEVAHLRAIDMSAPVKTDAVLEQNHLIAKRDVRAGSVAGEIGVSLSPHPRETRIQWFNQVRCIGRSRWDMGGLRMEAALYHPDLSSVALPGKVEAPAAECLAAAAAEIPALYEAIAAQYIPEDTAPLQTMIREHLLDFLRSCWKAEPGVLPSHPWLAKIPLFLSVDGRYLSVKDLNARKVILEPSVHPKKVRSLAIGYPDHVKLLFENSKLISGIKREQAAPKPAMAPPRKLPPRRVVKPLPEPAKKGEVSLPDSLRREDYGVKVDDLAVVDPTVEVRRWLKALKKRGACPLTDDSIETVSIDPKHPLLRSLATHGDLNRLMPYAVSICFTDLNRRLSELTDAQDTRFVLSLAELVLEADDSGEYKRVGN